MKPAIIVSKTATVAAILISATLAAPLQAQAGDSVKRANPAKANMTLKRTSGGNTPYSGPSSFAAPDICRFSKKHNCWICPHNASRTPNGDRATPRCER